MIIKLRQSKAQAVLEYIALIIVIMGAFMLFQKYIVRGFSGRWKNVGDGLAEGRIFSPTKTDDCMFVVSAGEWADRDCFNAYCPTACYSVSGIPENCLRCIHLCQDLPFAKSTRCR